MAASRCRLCGISYPAITQFETCPIHEERTTYLNTAEPDEDWQRSYERVAKLAQQSAEISDRPYPFARGVTAVEEDGLLFVDQSEMQRAGVRLSRMQPDQAYLFELEDGWVYETQGWHESRRRWWVERVAEADAPVAPVVRAE